MKQKMMLAAIAAVISVGGFAGFNAYRTNSSASDILLTNAEALAADGDELTEINCNEAIPEVCYIYNRKAQPGERY